MSFLQAEGMAGSSSGLSSSSLPPPLFLLLRPEQQDWSSEDTARCCTVPLVYPGIVASIQSKRFHDSCALPGSLLKVTLSPRWSFWCLVAPAAAPLQLRFLVSLPQTSTRIRLLYPTPRCLFSTSKDKPLCFPSSWKSD